MGVAGRLALVVIGLAAFVGAACGDDDDATIDPTVGSTTTATATGEAAPPEASASATATEEPATPPDGSAPRLEDVLVYTTNSDLQPRDLVVYDRAAEREHARIPLANQRSLNLWDAGMTHTGDLLLATEDELWIASLDGTRGPVLYEDPAHAIADFALSPDESTLAIARTGLGTHDPEDPEYGTGTLVFIDFQSGELISEVRDDDPQLAGEHFEPWIATWLADSSAVFVQSATYSEDPGVPHLVTTDGTVTTVDAHGYRYLSPDARTLVHTSDPVSCLLVNGRELVVQDLLGETGRQVWSVPGKILTPWAWSPDGTELLVRERAAEAARCDGPGEWRLFELDGSSGPVPDVDALAAGWWGEDRLQLECEGEREDVALGRFGLRTDQCPPGVSGTILLNGAPIGEGRGIVVVAGMQGVGPQFVDSALGAALTTAGSLEYHGRRIAEPDLEICSASGCVETGAAGVSGASFASTQACAKAGSLSFDVALGEAVASYCEAIDRASAELGEPDDGNLNAWAAATAVERVALSAALEASRP